MFLLVYGLIKNLHNFLGLRISIASHYIINETFLRRLSCYQCFFLYEISEGLKKLKELPVPELMNQKRTDG